MYKKFEKIGRCPISHKPLRFINNKAFETEDHKQVYPVVDGILDILHHKSVVTSISYDSISESYDSYISGNNFINRTYNRLFWGFTSDFECVNKILEDINIDFDGVIIDAPAGTGIYTAPKLTTLKRGSIFSLDYSMGMLRKSQRNFFDSGICNAIFIRADVTELPFIDSSVDIVLSFNGFHAFPQKREALEEIYRTLKPGGSILGSFYISKEYWITDLIVSHLYTNKKWFFKPFFTEREAIDFISERFRIEISYKMKSIFIFKARKLT
ncbi:MAG: class I SAM-dependent methyltransferase [Myxococcota bacterium]|nr:class I SAM-dependent methyltransferase [Myxococcota bacterium]